MKNYNEQELMDGCHDCKHCLTISCDCDFNYYCKHDSGDVPKYAQFCEVQSGDMSIDDYEKLDRKFYDWAKDREVTEFGICDHYDYNDGEDDEVVVRDM